jgi:hypothetical protein|tara:strand:- start:1179 stop:1517 length:339 start_codon:yes stop_codon:yes gene_type:complete
MTFFESELVKNEMDEISKLQEKVYSNVFVFPSLDRDGKLKHISDLEMLMEKQKILYMRLALSDDPDALNMKLKIQDSATMMGLPEDVDMNALFANMTKLVGNLKEQLLKEID